MLDGPAAASGAYAHTLSADATTLGVATIIDDGTEGKTTSDGPFHLRHWSPELLASVRKLVRSLVGKGPETMTATEPFYFYDLTPEEREYTKNLIRPELENKLGEYVYYNEVLDTHMLKTREFDHIVGPESD